jgi:hypothetical protein
VAGKKNNANNKCKLHWKSVLSRKCTGKIERPNEKRVMLLIIKRGKMLNTGKNAAYNLNKKSRS